MKGSFMEQLLLVRYGEIYLKGLNRPYFLKALVSRVREAVGDSGDKVWLKDARIYVGGIQDMATLPDVMFVIDVGHHKIAVSEAKKLGIPLIGVVDTNHNPEGIDYVIPGNDDSARAVTLYARAIADAILEGKANAVEEVARAVQEAEGGEFVEVSEGAPAAEAAEGGEGAAA